MTLHAVFTRDTFTFNLTQCAMPISWMDKSVNSQLPVERGSERGSGTALLYHEPFPLLPLQLWQSNNLDIVTW